MHEFQADEKAASDKHAYQELLVSSIFNTCALPFAHSFIIHPIKRRIMMLHKRRNKTAAIVTGSIAAVAVAILFVGSATLQSCCKTEKSVSHTGVVSDLSKA